MAENKNDFNGTVQSLFSGMSGVLSTKTVVGDAVHDIHESHYLRFARFRKSGTDTGKYGERFKLCVVFTGKRYTGSKGVERWTEEQCKSI